MTWLALESCLSSSTNIYQSCMFGVGLEGTARTCKNLESSPSKLISHLGSYSATLWVKHYPSFCKLPWEREQLVTSILISSLLKKNGREWGGQHIFGGTGANWPGREMGMSAPPASASSHVSSVDATSSLQDGAPSHHHTVHLGSAAPCIHCSRNKRPPLVRQGRSKEGKGRPRPGETTVFSVGRWGQ